MIFTTGSRTQGEFNLNTHFVMNTEIDSPVTNAKPDEAPEVHPDEAGTLTGVGIFGGGAAGAVIGGAVAGPVGAVIGAVIGAVAGGAGGSSAVAEAGESKHYEPLMVPPTHEEIANRAWKYFETEGRTDGHDFDDWVRAESDLYREALAERGNV